MLVTEQNFKKSVIRLTLTIAGIILLMRLTFGLFGVVIMLAGISYAFANKTAKALAVYILYPFLAVLNGMLCPHMPMYSMFTRVGTVIMTFGMIMSATKRSGREKMPLGGMFLFIVMAFISSMNGYFPMISYLKLINFTLFILGLYMGVQNIHQRPEDMLFLRAFCFAIMIVLIGGSICTLPFPGIAYSTTVAQLSRYVDVAEMDAAVRDIIRSGTRVTLFAGITNQSQCLAPMLACASGWLVCDMVVAERRVERWHVCLLIGTLPLMYMTRSRVAFVSLVAIGVMVYFYLLPKAKMSSKAKGRIRNAMFGGLAIIMAVSAALEFKDHTISRWLRKSEDVAGDTRGLTEAVTASRQGKIDIMMNDFHRSPLIGTGFQVFEYHKLAYQMGEISIFSAPVEKGVLPIVVLSETGIAGSIAFVLFLIMFYGQCFTRKYLATSIMFTTMLVTNLGEATFFSPSGVGGIIWIISMVGGFVIDMYAKYGNRAPMNMFTMI